MTVDAIIPNFNGSHLYKKNLPHVWEALRSYGGKIIIVDDGSVNEDKEKLAQIIEEFRAKGYNIDFVNHKINKGFSSAVNSGVKASHAEFVALLNSDVCPRKDFLESPLDHLTSDPLLFGVGSMDESKEAGKTVLRGRGIAKWQNGFLAHSKGEVNARDTFWISGGSSVIRRSMYVELGGMDEIYNPFYWEDIDLSYRAQKAGFKILFDNQSVVEHYHDEGAIKKQFTSATITTTSSRNQLIFIWKNITSFSMLSDHFLRLPWHVIKSCANGNTPFAKGFFLALLLLPAIINKRLKQKEFYKVSDAEIINRFHE